MLSSDDTSEEQLEEVMKEVEAEEAEEDAKEQQAVAFLQSREEKKMAIQVETQLPSVGFSSPFKVADGQIIDIILFVAGGLEEWCSQSQIWS